MKNKCATLAWICLFALSIQAQTPIRTVGDHLTERFLEGTPLRLPLWPDGAPISNGIDYTTYQRDPDPARAEALKRLIEPDPEIFVYLPQSQTETAPTKAVVACAGGGYISEMLHQEGMMWHDFFQAEGIAFILVGYRLPFGHHEVPASDVYQAIRIVQAHAPEWNIDPTAIGVMGSSAGGHLASTVATHAPDSVRPAFQILFYPVISLATDMTTECKARKNLLGENPTDELLELYCNYKQVDNKTPRALIFVAGDDDVVTPLNSVFYYEALLKAGIPASLHIYPTGGHGFGAHNSFRYHYEMIQEIKSWLRSF